MDIFAKFLMEVVPCALALAKPCASTFGADASLPRRLLQAEFGVKVGQTFHQIACTEMLIFPSNKMALLAMQEQRLRRIPAQVPVATSSP
jgi:hypothetical protein